MKEWQRTILLLLLIAFAIGYIMWNKQANTDTLIQGLGR
jgi:lipopolysaccharide export system protein LptC